MDDLKNLILQNYVPGKYDLHTRFIDYYPEFPSGGVPVDWLPGKKFEEETGESEEVVRGMYDPRIDRITNNLRFFLKRLPASLDPDATAIARILKHEGAHAWYERLSPEEKEKVIERVATDWPKEQTPGYIKELLRRGYVGDMLLGYPDRAYFERLGNEMLAHMAEEEIAPPDEFWNIYLSQILRAQGKE